MSKPIKSTHTNRNSNINQGNNTSRKKKQKKTVLPNGISTNSNGNQANLAVKKKRTRRGRKKPEMTAIPQQPNSTSRDILAYCKNLTVKELDDPGLLWVDKITESNPSFNEQVSLVIAAVEADEQFYEYAKQLCNDLESILRKNLPELGVSAASFGSVVTHLALKYSDVDVFLFFDTSINFRNTLKLVKDIIDKYKSVLCFYNTIAINAKVPIVKCLSANAISCDISFSCSFGIYKSQLIEFLIGLDDRIRPVIIILKFWLKTQNLLEGNKISSYALAILAIFYFQQCENPLLPTVYQLQKNLPPKIIIEGWSVTFRNDKTLKPKTENNLSLFDFLKGFFRFYGGLDYNSYVISPFVGKLLPITLFNNSRTVPKEFFHLNPSNKIIEPAAMYLQDPFVHDYNVTKSLDAKFCLQFSGKCCEAYKICEEEEKKTLNKNYKSVFFKELFRRNKPSSHKISSNVTVVEIFQKSTKDKLSKLKWADLVHKSIFEILTKILKCRVGVGSTPDKIFKTVEKSQPDVFTCEMDFDFLNEEMRKRASGFVNNVSFLQRQEKISDYLLQNVFKDYVGKCGRFQIVSYVKNDPVRLRLNFVNLENGKGQKRKFVSKVLNWLGKNLPGCVDKGMKG